MPVGHIWKFDLERTFTLDFGVKCNCSKTRIVQVMLKFLATTENIRKNNIRRFELQSRESSQNWQREIAIRNFRYIIRTRVELSHSWQETESNRERKESKFEWTRVNLR